MKPVLILVPPLAAALLAAAPGWAEVVVPVRTIPAQSILEPGDLVLAPGRSRGAFDSPEAVAGLETRTILYVGRPILSHHVGAPALVERNGPVVLSYQQGAVRILVDGRALGRAGLGETVRVLNQASRVAVSGIVTGQGVVSVGQSGVSQ